MGHFKCDYFGCINTKLKNLINAPRVIEGDLNLDTSEYLESLEGGPEIVKGSFYCNNTRRLKSLEGAPKYIGKHFSLYNSFSL